MTNTVKSVFISYRRSDHPQFAHRIRDRFVEQYQAANVFMDFYSIPLFSDFAQVIEAKIVSSNVVVAIIGPHWLEILNKKLEDEEPDYLLAELELAVRQGKLVVSICIEGASVPNTGDLPSSIRPIFSRQVASLAADRHFDRDIKEIVQRIEEEYATWDNNPLPPYQQPTAIIGADEKLTSTINVQIIINSPEDDANQLEAKTLFYSGANKQTNGDYGGAIRDYTKAIHLIPHFAWAFNSRGAARRALGDVDGALADYDQAIRYDSRLFEAYHNKGIALNILGDYDNAILCFNEALRIEPTAESASRRATAYVHKGDNQRALADYAYALVLEPTNWMVHSNRGTLHYTMGDMDEALTDFDKAIELGAQTKPPADEFHLAYCNRANTYIELGRLENAQNDIEHAMALASEFAGVYELEARLWIQKGNPQRAITAFTNALNLDPKNSHYFGGRGWQKHLLGHNPEAIEDYNQALGLDPLSAETYNNRGIAKRILGDLEGALADFALAEQYHHPHPSWIYNNRGLVLVDKREFELAISAYSHAIELEPQYANAYINRANVYVWQDKIADAVADLTLYLELGGGELNSNRSEIELAIHHLKRRGS